MTVLCEHLLGHPVDVVEVREVALVDVGDPASRGDLIAGQLELLRRAGDQQHGAARLGDLQRRRLADPRGGPGHHDHPPAHGGLQRHVADHSAPETHELVGDLLLEDLREPADEAEAPARGPEQRAIAEQVRVEVALPVVPELARVGLERRHPDPGALERGLGLARVEVGRVVDVDEHRTRDAEVGEQAIEHRVRERGRRQRDLDQRLGRLDRARRDAHRRLRRVRGAGEDVDHLAGRLRVRVGEVEGPAVEVVDVGDVVHRLGDEVDGHDVDLAPLDPGHRQPLRDRVADPSDQLEEVVRAVDLVHLAGLGVADDDPGPVDAPRAGALVAHDGLGLVLGLEVGVVVDVLGLVEHVLAPGALVEAGGGDRADHVHAPGIDGLGELDHVAGALDVRDALRLGVRGHVVDRGQVEEVVDLALEPREVLVGDAEAGLGEVTDDADDAVLVDAPAVAQLLEPALRALSHEHVDRPLALEQQLDQVAADEPGRSGDEVAHLTSSIGLRSG